MSLSFLINRQKPPSEKKEPLIYTDRREPSQSIVLCERAEIPAWTCNEQCLFLTAIAYKKEGLKYDT